MILGFFKKLRWSILFITLMECVEKIEFDTPPANSLLVIEGMISDLEKPYTVKISRAMNLSSDSLRPIPVTGAQVILFDELGNSEPFSETTPGEYTTGGLIKGEIGKRYHIQVETEGGLMFESKPEVMKASGELLDVYYEYEPRTVVTPYGETEANVLNVYVDGIASLENENYLRWKYTGTYRVVTNPEFHMTETPPYSPYKDPWPCSGMRVVPGPAGSGGLLEKFADCICCECWARQYEQLPQLSDTQLVTDNEFKKIKVGEIPINGATFFDKYMVEVQQMNLTKDAFDFYKLIREQKENAASIFQPPSGELRGNISPLNNDQPVVGLFWAASISEKVLFIDSTNVPYHIVPMRQITLPCYNEFPNSTTVKPVNWK